jgi:hypothetical protein
MNKSKFFVSLLTVVIYEILMMLVRPDGMSNTKVAITLLIWISFYMSFSTFILQYQIIKTALPKYVFGVFIALIIWNIINVVRGALSYDSITTIWGNDRTSLALLVPFFLSFGVNETNLRTINRLFTGLIITGTIGYFLFFFVFSSEISNYYYNQAFVVLFSGAVFLITIIPFQTSKIRLITFLGSLFLFYLAYETGSRTMMLRTIMLCFSLIAIYLYIRFNAKLIILVAFLTLLLPFILLQKSIIRGQSAFEQYLSKIGNIEFNDDTRTFLYVELFDDLIQNKKLLIGKGSNARYYSPYFAKVEGDSSIRIDIEVGILGLLLKGGLISVLLNLALLLIAIYLALFRTNNYLVMGAGLMLLVHTLLLFIENFIIYSTYNITVWFFIGVCLSKRIRLLNNIEIKNILINTNDLS